MSTERSDRRQFFRATGQVGVGLALTAVSPPVQGQGPMSNARPEAVQIGVETDLKIGQPIPFTYPDQDSPCFLVKTGVECTGGIGRERDIVAYSALCPHQGFVVSYDQAKQAFKCPAHYSQFDTQLAGQMICGQATTKLPRILLEVEAKSGMIRAIGIVGLIYGRTENTI